MTMNRGETNYHRRKLVDLFALTVLAQLPTLQVSALETAGVNKPEVTAKVHLYLFTQKVKVFRAVSHFSGLPRFIHIWSNQGLRKRKMGEGGILATLS
jgi:hypothetical protein